MTRNIFRALLCLTAFFSLAACASKHEGVDITRFGLADTVIAADLGALPQDLNVYAARAGQDVRLMDPARQGMEDARFDERFFAPWSVKHSPPAKSAVFEGARNMSPAAGFAENLRPWDAARWQDILRNAFEEDYGFSRPRPAITVAMAHLRRLPTEAPYFLNPGKGGEGFPFDYMQNSVLWVGTPVAVWHVSRDRMWAYVESGFVSGWTRVANLAAVDQAFIKAWRSRPMGVILHDGTMLSLTDGNADAVIGGRAAVEAHLGAILPFAVAGGHIRGAKSPHLYVHVPLRSFDGKAVMGTALVPIQSVRQKPMYLTPGNIARVGNAMMGQPYGWGGLFGQRDCSAAMRDLFAPFGIWLPRNSGAQGKTGSWLALEGLSPDAKEEKIMRDGVPFFSLVSMPGHVGLYLGGYPKANAGGVEREVPVMFHAIWGVRVVAGSGEDARDGRGVIGKAVVTTLRPGAEHPSISSPAGILDRIAGLAILPELLPGEGGRD